MQLNHIILIIEGSIKLFFSLRMDNKKATKSGFALSNKIVKKTSLYKFYLCKVVRYAAS